MFLNNFLGDLTSRKFKWCYDSMFTTACRTVGGKQRGLMIAGDTCSQAGNGWPGVTSGVMEIISASIVITLVIVNNMFSISNIIQSIISAPNTSVWEQIRNRRGE